MHKLLLAGIAVAVLAGLVLAPSISNLFNAEGSHFRDKWLGSLLKLSRTNVAVDIPLIKGWYDDKEVLYISTEASDRDVAEALTKFVGFKVTYAPALANTPPDAVANIYEFKNGVKGSGPEGFQPNVVDSIPPQDKYSPLWIVNFVTWKDPTKATELKVDDEISDAEKKGLLTVETSKIIVNCPIVKWGGSDEEKIPAGQMKLRDSPEVSDTSPYVGGQVLKIDEKAMKVTFVAHRGWAQDGSTIYYIVTDATMPDPAAMMGVLLTKKTDVLLKSSAASDLFQFTNGIKGSGPMGFQAGIAGSKPGQNAYSPMWRIQMITWNSPSNAQVLETLSDINTYHSSGKIKVEDAGMIVNCPFIELPS